MAFYKKINYLFAESEDILKLRNKNENYNFPIEIIDYAKQNNADISLIKLAIISKY